MRRHLAPLLRRVSLSIPVILLGIAFLGCSDRERLSRPESPSEDWSFGESRIHDVPSAADVLITDSSTVEVFSFPEGGGRLTVTPILGGPELDAEDSAFEIEYTGTGAVELVIVQAADDVDIVLSHRPFDDVIQEGDRFEAAGWIPLASVEDASDTVRIELFPADDVPGKGFAAAPAKVSKFRRIRVKKSDDYGVKLSAFKSNVKLAVDELVLAVADHRRPAVRSAVDGHLAYTVHLRERAKVGNDALPCYAPYYREDLKFYVWCGIMMIDDCAGGIAHETGHYFHHVLLGTEAFSDFKGLPEGHKIGRPGAKYNLVEEPAYFAEYYLKGLIGTPSTFNPETGTFLTGQGAHPNTTDFTDLEGFGTALLASLTRTNTQIRDFENRVVPVPVVDGEVLTRFQAAWEIFAKGTNNIPDLRQEIENYLFANNIQDEKLPAMLEPIGWSYNADCVFLDDEGQRIDGLTARSVYKVGSTTYALPKGTGDDRGVYHLNRVFPGNSHIRVYIDEDSIDVPVTVGWSRRTTETLPFDGLVVREGMLALLQRQPAFIWNATGTMVNPGGGNPYDALFSVTNVDPPGGVPGPAVSWNGTVGTCDFEYRHQNEWNQVTEYEFHWRVTVSRNTDAILFLELTIHNSIDQPGFHDEYQYSVKVRDIPRVGYPGDNVGNTQFIYKLWSTHVPGKVTETHYRRDYNGIVLESSEFNAADGDWQLLIGQF